MDDFILLDDLTGRWRGQIYLLDPPGVYDLQGTFVVSQPGVSSLLQTGLVMVMLLRSRPRKPALPRIRIRSGP